MNKINRKVEYALIGLKHMRGKTPGELTTVKEITNLYGCPFDVTSRVMQILAQKGILRSEQGAHGGYMIARDLARVSFFELLEFIMGPVAVAKCMQSDDSHDSCEIRATCNIVSPVQTLNRRLIEFYKSLSLSELLDPRGSTALSGRASVTGVVAGAAEAANELASVAE